MVNEVCTNYEYDFETVYTKPNKTYNDGYKKLGMEHVIRPVLSPPEGVILGHCIVPNFDLLPATRLKHMLKEINNNAQ